MRLWGVVLMIAAGLYADDRCLTCHPSEARSWSTTGMARSASAPVRVGDTEQTVRHAASGTLFSANWTAQGSLVHKLTRSGRSASYPIQWKIGSGSHGSSYLHNIGGALFESPLSWYAQRATWDLSPGFEADKAPDFFRPVTPDCLSCHSGGPRPVSGTQNRYQSPALVPVGIDCDRCHGDGSAHVAKPGRANIVNPVRLEPARRDAVCEQCHLSGEARILNPGKQFSDFRPGDLLEDSFSVYVNRVRSGSASIKVVSHSEQMALSACSIASGGKLWCGTCHNPHDTPDDKVTWYRDRCLGCHAGRDVAAHRTRAGDECADCHMPQTKAYDGGHTAFHDHRIRKPGRQTTVAAGQALELQAWREPAAELRSRNMGLALIGRGISKGDSTAVLNGFRLLSSISADGEVETARGLVLLKSGKAREALMSFERALAEQPDNSTRLLNAAAASLAAGDADKAVTYAKKAIEREPLLEDAYALLAEAQPNRAAYWKQQYLRHAPQRTLP